MDHFHKRFSGEQVKVLFQGYCQGTMTRGEIEEMLNIGKTRFFALLKEYRRDAQSFSIDYQRETHARLSEHIEKEIKQELLREKKLVEDRQLPISGYNYAALRDRLKKKGAHVSATTIIKRVKALECYKPHCKGKPYDREVVTTAIGALVQHDASFHRWSPLTWEKWTLITSIDDYSRMLLFADFFAEETSWAHIQAAQKLMQTFGLPLRYYSWSITIWICQT